MVIFPEDVHCLPSSSPVCRMVDGYFKELHPKAQEYQLLMWVAQRGWAVVAFRTGFNLLIESLAVIPAGERPSAFTLLSRWRHPADHLQVGIGRDWQCSLSSALSGQRLKGGKTRSCHRCRSPVVSAFWLTSFLYVQRVQKCWTTPAGDFGFLTSPLPCVIHVGWWGWCWRGQKYERASLEEDKKREKTELGCQLRKL